MGTIIIKPNRDVDEYVLWSTGTDGPWFLGNREETLAELIESSREKEQYARPESLKRLDRTDENGSSELVRGDAWDPEEEFIYEQNGWIKRSDIGTLARELFEKKPGWKKRVKALLGPLEG